MDETRPPVPESAPPLVVDIDGTLTDRARELDGRTFPVLRAWPAPLVVATGKAMPFAVALCEYLVVDPIIIAENGGVALVEETDTLQYEGDREAARGVLEEYERRGYDPGWGTIDLANRWRETEVVVRREAPLAPLEVIAHEFGLEVVDTGYAYHVKSPGVTKGTALEVVLDELGRDPATVAAVGDSVNDVAVFERVGCAIAVANADDEAVAAADHVTDASYGEGFLEAVEWLGG